MRRRVALICVVVLTTAAACADPAPAELEPAGLLGIPGRPYGLSVGEAADAAYVPGSSVLTLPDGQWYFMPEGEEQPQTVASQHPAALEQVAESQHWLANGEVPGTSDEQQDMAERALLDLRLLTMDNGAVAAAWRGIWKYSWPRDSAFAAAAFAVTGHLAESRRILDFNAASQRTDCTGQDTECVPGTWEARTELDGSGPPDDRAWQLDANGWLPWATWQYVHALPQNRQGEAIAELYPMVELASDTAADMLDERGLPPARPDYWESDFPAPNLGTAAPLLAGLRAAADIAEAADEDEDAARWWQAAEELARGIEDTFATNGYQRSTLQGSGKDSAITFLAPPFTAPPPGVRTAIEDTWGVLRQPTGGVQPGEDWDGDETWTPETMFFALAWANDEQVERADGLLTWLAQHRTGVGSLPEKVSVDGEPAAVAPLGWTASLTLLTLASRDEPLPVPPATPEDG